MPDQIVITGATGFIGRNLVPVLLAKGLRLALTVRDMEQSQSRRAFPDHPAIKLIPYESIASNSPQPEMLSNTRAVVHLAGLAHAPQRTSEHAFFQANALATRNLVENVRRSEVPLLIHMSSIGAVTGNSNNKVIDDWSKPNPCTDYGRSKLAAEEHVATLAHDGICAISLRPPLVIGHDAKGNWARLQRLALSGAPLPFRSVNNSRSIVPVELLAEAISYLCENRIDVNKSGNYCIADRTVISLADILIQLRTGMGIPARLFPLSPALLHFAANVINKSQIADSVIGNLVLDPRRFFSTFPVVENSSLQESIRESGRIYSISRN